MQETINLECLFCGSGNFKLVKDGEFPREGELIECAECGRENDASFLIEQAKQKAIHQAKEEISKKIKSIFKRRK